MVLLLVAGCGDEDTVRTPTGPGRSDDTEVSDDTDGDTDTDTDTDTDPGPCPDGMVDVDEVFCIDAFEGSLEVFQGGSWTSFSPYERPGSNRVRARSAAGVPPQGYISGTEAAAACAESGKRLCTSAEWLRACRGPEGFTWPYGDSYDASACNDTYPGSHPVVDYFGTSDGVWDPTHMNDPGINQQDDTVDPTGANARCVSAYGAFDLHGNLHEWVADADGTFRGGFYADARINGQGCTYRTTAHSIGYHDYSTGFRCCADP